METTMAMATSTVTSKESSISVAVRVRPLTAEEQFCLVDPSEVEQTHEYDSSHDMEENKENTGNEMHQSRFSLVDRPYTIKKIIDVVDDRMIIFDPKPINTDSNEENISYNHHRGGRRTSRSDNLGGSGIGSHNKRHKEQKFIFDRLFDENSTQRDIYDNTTKASIDAVLDGYNSTIFAYGATGCGKTYTITGTPENPGIVFLALQDLFEKIENQNEKDVTIEVSYLEIYNEMIKDLLNIETSPKKLILLESKDQEIIVTNLTKTNVLNVNDVMDLIIRGNSHRTVSPTEANLTSSRSHAVLQVYITQTPLLADIYEKNTKSVLSIIDLAGSERASATKNKGIRLHEGANINRSLLALGNCINALCENRKSVHVPYRNSKLTRLLKFSLGGNCKTVMIVCISPSSRHYDETLNALKFANRAKEIKTKVMRNRTTVMKHVGSYMKIIQDQKRRIYELETLMETSVLREVSKHSDRRRTIKGQIDSMIERLYNNLAKCESLKYDKILIIAKRKLLLVYIKQIGDFHSSLVQFDLENKLQNLKSQLGNVLETLKSQVSLLEEKYTQKTELDIVLLENSKAFLSKLRELDGWTDEFEEIFLKEVEYLKSDIERQLFYESSVLFDSWIYKTDDIGGSPTQFDAESMVDTSVMAGVLARYLCIIEDMGNDLHTVEEARMKCFQLSDDLIQNCMIQIKAIDSDELFKGLDLIGTEVKRNASNHKKRKNEYTSSINPGKLESSHNILNLPNDTDAFVRQGNRINSINNKLMRVNLEANSTKDEHMDTVSEIESSLILDNNPTFGKSLRVPSITSRATSNSIPANYFIPSESTPQGRDKIADGLTDEYELSPSLKEKTYGQKSIHEISPIMEWDESNSSVIINKDGAINGTSNNVFTYPKKLNLTPSPAKPRRGRVRSGTGNDNKLTAKKLTASPRINSPHRLLGFDSMSTNFQFGTKLDESVSTELPKPDDARREHEINTEELAVAAADDIDMDV